MSLCVLCGHDIYPLEKEEGVSKCSSCDQYGVLSEEEAFDLLNNVYLLTTDGGEITFKHWIKMVNNGSLLNRLINNKEEQERNEY